MMPWKSWIYYDVITSGVFVCVSCIVDITARLVISSNWQIYNIFGPRYGVWRELVIELVTLIVGVYWSCINNNIAMQ